MCIRDRQVYGLTAGGAAGAPFVRLQSMLRGISSAYDGGPPAAPADTRLAAAPRRVPVSFLLAELLPFRWWYVFAMFMVATAPIIVWIKYPAVVAPAGVAVVA